MGDRPRFCRALLYEVDSGRVVVLEIGGLRGLSPEPEWFDIRLYGWGRIEDDSPVKLQQEDDGASYGRRGRRWVLRTQAKTVRGGNE